MLALRYIICNLSLWSPAAARNRRDFQARTIGDENRSNRATGGMKNVSP
jgi:hypothetical protein